MLKMTAESQSGNLASMLYLSFSDLERMFEYFSLPIRLAMCASRISVVSFICVLLFGWIFDGAAGCVFSIVFLLCLSMSGVVCRPGVVFLVFL